MKGKLVSMLISMLVNMLTPELMKNLLDMLLDWIENMVLGSASTVDDKMVLPLCEMIRSAFDIPDDD